MAHLIVIVGPTASGKSAVAMALAKHYHCAIFSADARQFYQEMSIGTAKPTSSDLATVPHYFIDNLSIKEDYTAGKYEQDCIEQLTSYFKENKMAILCGGSGLFIRAVLEGIEEKVEIDETIRAKVRLMSLGEMQIELKKLDPIYYEQVDAQNGRRLSRALEIIWSSGKPLSEQLAGVKKVRDFSTTIIGIDTKRELLYEQINHRVEQMLAAGLEKEVQSLLQYKDLNNFKTVGYQEWIGYFEGIDNLERVKYLIQRNTRHYAKRQLTWFQKMEHVYWLANTQIAEMIKQIDQDVAK